jgi:nucleoside-diphosphate-sugar epimerase
VITGACAVTGTTGYVGSVLADGLRDHMPVVPLIRHVRRAEDLSWSLQSRHDLTNALRERDVKVLVHAAWDMREISAAKNDKTCVEGSARLFAMCARAGVERIVFISTISAFEGCRSVYGRAKLAVEKELRKQEISYVIFRPGLIFGPKSGGMFGSIRKQVQASRILPMIGLGNVPQYLLHENMLVDSVRRAIVGEFDVIHGAPITLADPTPHSFLELVKSVAASEQREVKLVPLPSWLLYAGIRTGELFGLHLPFRSDSITSFLHYDRNPDFSLLKALQIRPLPFDGLLVHQKLTSES